MCWIDWREQTETSSSASSSLISKFWPVSILYVNWILLISFVNSLILSSMTRKAESFGFTAIGFFTFSPFPAMTAAMTDCILILRPTDFLEKFIVSAKLKRNVTKRGHPQSLWIALLLRLDGRYGGLGQD